MQHRRSSSTPSASCCRPAAADGPAHRPIARFCSRRENSEGEKSAGPLSIVLFRRDLPAERLPLFKLVDIIGFVRKIIDLRRLVGIVEIGPRRRIAELLVERLA